MTYDVLFHPNVEDDLTNIAMVITDYSGFKTAKTKLKEIEQDIKLLAQTPHKGSVRSELPGNIRAIPAGKRAVIVFEVDERSRTIYVLAITYGGADWLAKLDTRYDF